MLRELSYEIGRREKLEVLLEIGIVLGVEQDLAVPLFQNNRTTLLKAMGGRAMYCAKRSMAFWSLA